MCWVAATPSQLSGCVVCSKWAYYISHFPAMNSFNFYVKWLASKCCFIYRLPCVQAEKKQLHKAFNLFWLWGSFYASDHFWRFCRSIMEDLKLHYRGIHEGMSWLSGTSGTILYDWRLFGMEQKQYLANNTLIQYNERLAITAAHMMTGIGNTGQQQWILW